MPKTSVSFRATTVLLFWNVSRLTKHFSHDLTKFGCIGVRSASRAAAVNVLAWDKSEIPFLLPDIQWYIRLFCCSFPMITSGYAELLFQRRRILLTVYVIVRSIGWPCTVGFLSCKNLYVNDLHICRDCWCRVLTNVCNDLHTNPFRNQEIDAFNSIPCI